LCGRKTERRTYTLNVFEDRQRAGRDICYKEGERNDAVKWLHNEETQDIYSPINNSRMIFMRMR
jgi:hypothetical protein